MAIRVKLSDIIDGLESQSDRLNSYLNKETGEVVLINEDDLIFADTDEPIDDLPEWQQESIHEENGIEISEE